MGNPITIHQLRKNGWKVRVNHFRVNSATGEVLPIKQFVENGMQNQIAPKGGRTQIEVTTPENENHAVEVNCYFKDAYNRKLGLIKCLGKLVGKFPQLQQV